MLALVGPVGSVGSCWLLLALGGAPRSEGAAAPLRAQRGAEGWQPPRPQLRTPRLSTPGDVHFLLHSTGTVERWQRAGVRWVYFFQDTNAPCFKLLPACLAVSKKLAMEVNSVCVARRAGEAIGGIMQLSSGAKSMTANVEYNQIDALLKATVEPRGDVAGPDGFSPWPGSINQVRKERY